MSKSIRSLAPRVLPLLLSFLLLSLTSTTVLAQSKIGRAAIGVGPDGSQLLSEPATGTPVWVDMHAKTFVESWVEYNTSTCAFIDSGEYTMPPPVGPKHGKLFYTIENSTLINGDCPGITFPFNTVRFTWTDSKQEVLQDPFTLRWKTKDRKFTETNSFTAELAKITQAEEIWWVCGVSGDDLPDNVKLTLENAPSGAASFVWDITAGSSKLAFSNGAATITTTMDTAGINSLAESTSPMDVDIKVVVEKLTYSFKTTVRTPKQLKRTYSLDHDGGRGSNCNVAGTLGWQSYIGYEIDDQFGINTATPNDADAGINEQFGAKTNYQMNNWNKPAEKGSDTPRGLFRDNMCQTGAWMPHPLAPPPLTNNLVDRVAQTWFAGSRAATHQGCEVQTDAFTRLIDHGRHLSIVSPPVRSSSVGAVPVAGSVTGYPMPVPNVRYLARQASIIVKGRVLDVKETRATSTQTGSGSAFRNMTASLQVDRVLKGNVVGDVITVDFLENPDVLALTLDQNEYALLFLTSDEPGRYRFADPQVGKMAITGQNVQLAGSAQTTASKLEAELVASLFDSDPEVAKTALEQVGNLGSVDSTRPIRDIAMTGTPDFQGLAHVALLRLGEYSLLDRAIIFSQKLLQDPDVLRLQYGVADAIGDIRGRSVLPTLQVLLASPNVSLRRSAAKALRGIVDPSSIPFLMRALDDPDGDVQYHAMMALAGLAGPTQDNAPARDIFDRSPRKYLDQWKSWRQTGKRSYGSSR